MNRTPIVTTIDIETAPMTTHNWGLFNQNIGLSQVIEPSRVLGFGAKQLDKPVKWFSEFHHSRDAMVDAAWNIYNESDVLIHFNGTSFDLPWLRREFVLAGKPPPSPVLEIDLVRVVRKQFRFESNKLQNVSTMLGLAGKLSHSGHQMWVDCLNGDAKAWNLMRRYCKQDVVLTEQLYYRLRPWITNHPSLALMAGETRPTCTNCSSLNLTKQGLRHTAQSSYQRYQCQDCGSWSRATRRDVGVSVRGV